MTTVEKKKDIPSEEVSLSEIGTNVWLDKPDKGTVIHVITDPVTLQEFALLSDTRSAMANATDVKLPHALEIEQAYRKWWNDVCTKNEINTSWPMRLDTVTGFIFIDE